MTGEITVLRKGLLSTVQDLGRWGLAHLGVSRSGALDAGSLRLANRLVGNPEGAAGIETTILGIDVHFGTDRWVAVTGADCALSVDGRAADANRAVLVPAGSVLEVGPASNGARTYLGVAGGIAVPALFGSRSTDTLSHLGPPPLEEGNVLPVGADRGRPAPVDLAVRRVTTGTRPLRLIRGPRHELVTLRSLDLLVTQPYLVSDASDRVGARLLGVEPLQQVPHPALPSEGVVLGSVQVPPGGQPIVFLADHPTTGGYPVVAVVHPADVGLVAQAPPGTALWFTWFRPGR